LAAAPRAESAFQVECSGIRVRLAPYENAGAEF